MSSFQGRTPGGDHLPGGEGIEDEVRKAQPEGDLPGDRAEDEVRPEDQPASEAEADE